MKTKRIVQNLLLILILLLFISFFSLIVHADDAEVPTNNDVNLGGQGSSADNVWGYDTLGFDDVDGGYRIYLENKYGAVVGPVIDLWFDLIGTELNTLPTGNVVDKGMTSIGNKKRLNQIKYSAVSDYIPGLKPPIYLHQPFGEQLNIWFETNNKVDPSSTNAEAFIVAVYSAAGVSQSEIKDYIINYQHDNYRIVVEAVYWFGYLWPEVIVPYDNGNGPLYFYGTIKELAAFESGNPTLQKEVGVNQTYLDGSWHFAQYTNGMCATALMLKEDDKYSGMKVISETKNSRSRYLYSQILKSDQSFGIHVILREQVSEKWATYDATKYGGTVGTSPGKTPKMSEIAGFGEDTWREVTVIKYYEEAVKQPNGKITYQKVSGPHKQTKICMTIEVQDEPGWVLKEFTQTQADHGWELYGNINKRDKNHTGFSPATVEVDTDRGWKYLIVWLVKDADPIDLVPQTEEVELELSESEISAAFVTNQVKGNTKPEFKFSWTNPHIAKKEYCRTDTEKVMEKVLIEKDRPIIEYNEEGVLDYWDANGNPVFKKDSNGNIITHKVETIVGYEDVYDWREVTKKHEYTHDYTWKDPSLVLKIKLDDLRFSTFSNILGTADKFKPVLNQDNISAVVDALTTDNATLSGFSANFTVWRGKDRPTILSYKDSPAGDSSVVLSLLGNEKGLSSGDRMQSSDVEAGKNVYPENLELYFKQDTGSGTDYTILLACLNNKSNCVHGELQTVDVADSNKNAVYTFKGSATVDYFNGDPNHPVTKIKLSADVIRRYPAYDNVKFYPYYQMSYQTTSDANADSNGKNTGGIVYVAGSYQREFKAAAALKLTWKENYYTGTKYSMLVRSDQWLTHATALENYGKNILLPGGAIHQVTTNANSSTKLGGTLTIEAWYPDVLKDYKTGVTQTPTGWDGNNGEDEFDALVDSAKSAIENSAQLEFRVVSGKKDSALSGLTITAGTELGTLGTKGLKASTDSKYLINSDSLNAANSKMAAVLSSTAPTNEIKIIAKPNGEVQAGSQTLLKKQGASAITDSAVKTADNYTSLVLNFLASLQRNAGNDTKTTFANYWANEDGRWYNEAFGFKINHYKATITVSVPANDGNGTGGVTAVLDPNLCPSRGGTASKFSSVNTGQYYMVLGNNVLGTFGESSVSFPSTSGYLLRSQPFYIADFTVQDND